MPRGSEGWIKSSQPKSTEKFSIQLPILRGTYEEVVCPFSVLCVPSHGCQNPQGRVIKEPNIPGSIALGETEIPQLQAHYPYSWGRKVTYICGWSPAQEN